MIVLSDMGGIAPKITPELLPNNMAQLANNVILHKGGVAPLKQTRTIATPTKSGVKKTIFRFGKDLPETQYWFTLNSHVHACRGPVVETTERTYFTGDGPPKKTDFELATGSGTSYPMAAYNLGVPAPTTAPVVFQYGAVGPSVAEQRAYVYTNVTAWVNFNGAGTTGQNQTINGSGNVASVYKNGTGEYTLTFTNAMPHTNYGVFITISGRYGSGYFLIGTLKVKTDNTGVELKSTTQVRIYTGTGGGNPVDISDVNVFIIA